ncbi:MAG: helix-turn-helix transcriptional regulator, partial [Acidobacteriota bacterium]
RTALEYDPYRQRVEKRLIRYLSWQWRIRAGEGHYLQPYRVETLLTAADLEIGDRPARTRERFEAALDRLETDRAIAAWQYTDAWREPTSQRPGWWRRWLDARVVIEPPTAILDAYRQLTRGPATRSTRASDDLGRRLAERRAALGWTQLRLAEALGISRSMISAIESSSRRPSQAVRHAIETWLAG